MRPQDLTSGVPENATRRQDGVWRQQYTDQRPTGLQGSATQAPMGRGQPQRIFKAYQYPRGYPFLHAPTHLPMLKYGSKEISNNSVLSLWDVGLMDRERAMQLWLSTNGGCCRRTVKTYCAMYWGQSVRMYTEANLWAGERNRKSINRQSILSFVHFRPNEQRTLQLPRQPREQKDWDELGVQASSVGRHQSK